MKSLQQAVEEGLNHVPSQYIQPIHGRPCVSEVCDKLQIPIIDLSGLLTGSDDRRAPVLEEIGRACEDWGFFQVVNHGVQQHVYDAMWAGAEKFFEQAPEERNRFLSDNHNQGVSYTASLDPLKEKILQWKDTLSIRRFPGICDGLGEAPQAFKAELEEYLAEVEILGNMLYEAIFESLGLTGAYLKTAPLPKMARVRTALNYYPTCPDPTLTFGVGPHSDSSCLTVLHAKPGPGLQIKKAEQWVPVHPLPYSFIINVADQIEILSNGKYKSVEHRVLANSETTRISIATFFGPTEDTKVAPLPKLIDENNPSLYEETTFGDYMKYVFSGNLLSRKQSLHFAIKASNSSTRA